jgi:large subunit ribosomal protein L17
MRHLKAGRKLGRNATQRLALMRSLALALFRYERIITTVAKAKEARRFVERLITLAKKDTLHARRLALARLGTAANAEVRPFNPAKKGDEVDSRTILQKLFAEIGPRFADRPGGYTRVIKRHERRLGDGGKTAFLELLKEGETKYRAKAPTSPAPQVEDEDEEETDSEEEQGETPAESEPEGGAPAPAEDTPPGENPPKP